MKLLALLVIVLVAVTLSYSHPNGEMDQKDVSNQSGDNDPETSTVKETRWNKTKKFFSKTFNKVKNVFPSNPKNDTTEASGLEEIGIIDESSEEVQSSTPETIGFWKRVKNIW
ncbi:hypothetical protein ACKWTF_014796 [Chironomus riparius]